MAGEKTDNFGAIVDPLNATYTVENQKVRLVDGRSEIQAVPGSATKIITSVFNKPVFGNIDGKNGVDAAVILKQDSGGSGTFYYIAAAFSENGFYRGTRAVLLGDRIAPQRLNIRNGVIIVNYKDRRFDEPMAKAPSVDISKYLVFDGIALEAKGSFSKEEEVLSGWIVVGHEVRSFNPCSPIGELWLAGDAPALGFIVAAYRKAMHNQGPYTPLFMTLAGKKSASPSEGFGADYGASFFVTQLVQVFPQGNCKSNLIFLDSPLPGSPVTSPLVIRGYARGKWFFEGDFPVVLLDADDIIISQGYATAKSPWMTEMFVPFESVIHFQSPGSDVSATLVLKKDNPTDKPEFDDALEIPILLK